MKSKTKIERIIVANKFIGIIASHGRRFFHHEGRVSHFELADTGHIYLIDKWTQARIYTHYKYRWINFSEGGTLRSLVDELVKFIQGKGSLPMHHLGPWHPTYCHGDLWGYGADMEKVRAECAALAEPIQ